MVVLLKICAVGMGAVIIIALVKQCKPEMAVGVSVCASVIMLSFIIGSLKEGFGLISEIYGRLSHGKEYLPVILKVLGIAYITEFAVALCSDAGEKGIGGKIELAGKVAIFFAAMPVFVSLLELLDGLL